MALVRGAVTSSLSENFNHGKDIEIVTFKLTRSCRIRVKMMVRASGDRIEFLRSGTTSMLCGKFKILRMNTVAKLPKFAVAKNLTSPWK